MRQIIKSLLLCAVRLSFPGHAYGRIFQTIITKLIWQEPLGSKKEELITLGYKSEKPNYPIITKKTKIYRRDRQFPAKY